MLSRELLRLRGVRVPPDAFDLDKLPPHLRITFRVHRRRPRSSPRARTWPRSSASCGPRCAPPCPPAPPRSPGPASPPGTSAPLPQVFTDGEVKAYPALVDAGDDRRRPPVRDPRRRPARAMRAGTRRLDPARASSPPPTRSPKRLTTAQKLVLSDNPHGSVAALFADAVNCAADGLIDRGRRPRLGRRRVRPARRARPPQAARRHLRGRHLGRGDPARRPRRPDPARRTAQPGARARRRRHPRPARRPHLPRLPHRGRRPGGCPALARYLKAIGRRLDKLPDNAGRDAQQMAVVHRVQDAYRDALAALPPPRPVQRRGPRDPLADRGAPGQPVRPDDRHPGPSIRTQDHDGNRPPHLTTRGRPRRDTPATAPDTIPSRGPHGSRRARGGPGPADFMITKENRAHRKIFLRDHAERRG